MEVHRNFSRDGQGLGDMASVGVLGTEPLAGSTGRAPGQGLGGLSAIEARKL